MMPHSVSIGDRQNPVYFWQPSKEGYEILGELGGEEVRGDFLCIRGLSKRELGETELACFAPVIDRIDTVALIGGVVASISSENVHKSSRIDSVYVREVPRCA